MKNTLLYSGFQALSLKQAVELQKDKIIEIKLKDADKTIVCKIARLSGKSQTVAVLDVIENWNEVKSQRITPVFTAKLISEKQIESMRMIES